MRLKIKRYNSCVGLPVGIGWKITRITESSECYYLNLYQPMGLRQMELELGRNSIKELDGVDKHPFYPLREMNYGKHIQISSYHLRTLRDFSDILENFIKNVL
jgi:hypothetical protein